MCVLLRPDDQRLAMTGLFNTASYLGSLVGAIAWTRIDVSEQLTPEEVGAGREALA